MAFEWDEAKRLSNLAKHGIDFAHAIEAFDDRSGLHFKSAVPNDHHEERYVLIGKAQGRIIAIVYVGRGALTRIISARPARRTERDRYESQAE